MDVKTRNSLHLHYRENNVKCYIIPLKCFYVTNSISNWQASKRRAGKVSVWVLGAVQTLQEPLGRDGAFLSNKMKEGQTDFYIV